MTVEVQIYRRVADPAWSFIVVNETGTSIYWTEDFETDEDALRAFEADIAQHGIESYRDDAPTTCPLCRKLDEALNEAVAGTGPGPGHHLPSDQPSCD